MVISTSLLTLKFITDDGKVGTIKVDQATVRRYYNDNLKVSSKRKRVELSDEAPVSDKVLMVELDSRVQCEGLRLKPKGELKEV